MTGPPRKATAVYEAPGETHTLVVDEGVEEMITLFQVNGVMIYVDPDGVNAQDTRDVFTKIAALMARPLPEGRSWAPITWTSLSAERRAGSETWKDR